MKTIAFIPARGGSKSIPLKNIKGFCGKPLIFWSLQAAEKSKSINEIVVSTDDNEIENVVSSFGFSKVKVFRRGSASSTDIASTESAMLEYISHTNLDPEDIFILIQATSPLLISNDLEKGLNMYGNSYDSILSGVISKRFFWSNIDGPINYDYRSRPRRQDFDGLFMENGAFYINSVSNIKNNKNRLSGKIGLCIMEDYTSFEIDEEEDWVIAESLMKRYILNNNLITGDDSQNIKLFVSDVDGVLTDAGMYYTENGDEIKKFNTHDGMAFQLLREKEIKTAIVTSENTCIVENRAKKLKVDYLYQGKKHGGKLEVVKEICRKEKISLNQVAYIGDDINCFELLSNVGLAACPNNAVSMIKGIPNIIILSKNGGQGVVREFYEEVLRKKL